MFSQRNGINSRSIQCCRLPVTLEETYIQPVEPAVSISEAEILLQISSGLLYLHNQNIVHANITPANVYFLENTIKIGGLDLSQITDECGTFAVDNFHPGADCFLAPEIIAWICESEENLNSPVYGHRSSRLTNKIDVFAAGCVFFFVLTKGYHPFGTSHLTISNNIMNSKQVNKKGISPSIFKVFTFLKLLSSTLNSAPRQSLRIGYDTVHAA